MLRTIIMLVLAALILAGCVTPAQRQAEVEAFNTNYAAVYRTYNSIKSKMSAADIAASFDDPAFRSDVEVLAQKWRTASTTLRYMPQPHGEEWAQAWPMIADAMDEYVFVASLIESAARENNPFPLMQGAGHLDTANALLTDAMAVLGRE